MSQENVEVARQVFDAMNRGDLPGAMKEATTDFIFDFSRSSSFERGVYEREVFPASWLPSPEIGNRCAGSQRSSSRQEASSSPRSRCTTGGRDGIEVRTRVAWVWAFRDRRVARITFFQNRSEALEAARLRE
jgi:ketosteroid isomerase-like protein